MEPNVALMGPRKAELAKWGLLVSPSDGPTPVNQPLTVEKVSQTVQII